MTLKYLIKRDGGIGDLISLIPALNKLKQPITIQTKFPEVFVGTNFKIIPYDSEVDPEEYKIIDLDGAVESKDVLRIGSCPSEDYLNKSRIDIWHQLLGVKPDFMPKFSWHVTEEETNFINNLLKGFSRPIVVYIPTCSSPYRTYPIELACAVSNQLNKNYDVIWAGDHGKWDNINLLKNKYLSSEILDLSEILNLRNLAALIAQADLVVTGDTGPMHIAAALSTPCLGLFGNIDPVTRINYYSTVSPIFKKLDCFCSDTIKNCPDITNIKSHRKAIGATCMWSITPQEIVNKANLMLSNEPPMDFIKFYAAEYFRGKGSSPEPLFNNNEDLSMIQSPTYDWIYSGFRHHLGGDENLINKIEKWKDKLLPNGKLIIHESIADIYKKTNKTANDRQSLAFVEKRIGHKFKIIKKEPVVHNNGFILILQKDNNG